MEYPQPDKKAAYTVMDYLHGKVADYTVSENVISAICFDRDTEPSIPASDVDERLRMLCYADLLRYIYLQPGMTKSYSQTNGTWSQKEGATQLSVEDKKKILAEIRRLYAKYGEPELIPPATSRSGIRMVSHGMKLYR